MVLMHASCTETCPGHLRQGLVLITHLLLKVCFSVSCRHQAAGVPGARGRKGLGGVNEELEGGRCNNFNNRDFLKGHRSKQGR